MVNLLYSEWDLGKSVSKSKGKICAWIYVLEIIASSEELFFEEEDGRVIGFCGYMKYGSTKHGLRKKIFRLLEKIAYSSSLIKYKSKLLQYNEDYDYCPDSVMQNYDGELSIIVVDKYHRQNGLGRKMLHDLFEKAKKDGIEKLLILTDQSCNYEFYDRIGCNKIYETTIRNGELLKCEKDYIQGYVYEKTL